MAGQQPGHGSQVELGNSGSFSTNPFSLLKKSWSHLPTRVVGRRGMLMDEAWHSHSIQRLGLNIPKFRLLSGKNLIH